MPHPHWRTRRASLLAIGALAAGLACLPAATAAAHGRAHLESAVSEELPTAPQPPVTEPLPAEPPSTESPSTEPPAGGGAPGESGRHARHEARRARRNDRGGECSLDLQATSAIVTAGTQLSLLGTLRCPEASSAAGQSVTLLQKLARTPGFNAAATTTTAADGTFQFTPEGLETNSVFYVRAGDARSDRVNVKIAPQVTIDAPAAGAQLLIGGTHAAHTSVDGAGAVTFTGTVSPADSGATVSLQREYRRGAWHRIGGGSRVDDEGTYSIVHAFSRPGQANIRVVVHSHGLEKTSASAPVTYQISRDRHRLLTIQASANPLVFGQAVTITGTVAGAVNQPVTLLAQTGDHPFVPVAEVTANGNEYSFTQSPQLSTRYRVRTASANSAVLSEDVTDAPSALEVTPSS
jgi:hypothetical protein